MKRTEVDTCPHCECENTFEWDVKADGYEVECPHCGALMMLCDACKSAEDNPTGKCDWKEGFGCFRAPAITQYDGVELLDLWRTLDKNGYGGAYQLEPSDRMIEATDNIRAAKGYTDLIRSEEENNVWYEYHLFITPGIRKIAVTAIVNNGSEDDYARYELSLTPQERETLIWKVMERLLDPEKD